MTSKIPFQLKLNQSLYTYSQRTAIEYGEHSITYSQLARTAARVTKWLMNKELENGCFVGIYLKNRFHLIASIIGILNARCVFVVLDGHLPVKRLETLVETTGIRVLLTDHEGSQRLQTETMALLDEEFFTGPFAGDNSEESGAAQLPAFERDDPIYIYYTSGSTGLPKAILGRNKGLLHFLEWESRTFGVDEHFRFSQFTAPGFDAFLRDVFTPLLNGGTLCIPASNDILPDRPRLTGWIDSRHITLIHCVPSVFRLFNGEELLASQFRGLKYVVMSGERIPPGQLNNWYRVFGERIRLVNFYGTSETTMAKTCYFIGPSDSKLARIPVGKPIRGARIFVLNENMKACSRMIAGEVYIRTPFRSLGYYNNPQANEECFIPNPFTNDPNDLFHRTGDLGRILDDDNLDIIGRLDSQVKIRGVRVEPEEIEAVLSAHPAIKESVVIARQRGDDETFLCAYFLNNNDDAGDITEETLRRYLAQRFPEYMVPRYFIGMESFPLTSNLKIDRKALPEPRLEAGKDYIAPSTPIQLALADIWAEVLNIDKEVIGVQSDFFRLGGHSLKATFMIEKVHKRLNVKIPLADVFKKTRIGELADFIGGLEEDVFAAIEPVEKRQYYPLSPAQKRMFILQQIDLDSTVYNMTQVIPLPVAPDRQRLYRCCMELIRRHHSLRTSFKLLDDEPVQLVWEMEEIRFAIEYTETEEIEEAPGDITASFVRPFDLNRAPLLRVGLFRLSENQFILVSDMHHIISDGVSLTILEKDFVALYTGQALPDLPIQYKDYSQWHNSKTQKENLKRQEQYWLSQMGGEIPILNIPLDFPRPEVQSFEGSALHFGVGPKETQILKRLALENNATLYMVLLSIYYVFLSKLSGQEEVIVGAPIAGRRHADLDQVIGMFVNTLVLRNYPGAEKTFVQFLEEVKKDTLGAFDNQEYQFEDLVEKVGVKRDAGRNPLFDVVYILQNIGDLPVDGPAEPAAAENPAPSGETPPAVQPSRPNRTAKFDLTLMMHEQPGSLHAMFQYSTRLFKEETIKRFIAYFNHVVTMVTDDRDILLSDISLIPEKEKQRILVEFNRTGTDYPKDKTIHQLFEEQAVRTPDATALAGVNKTYGKYWTYMSYSLLNEEADLLANRLRRKGAGPGLIIALKMERRLEMIISIMAILKTGGAYLPIETGFPRERVDYMLNDSTASLLIDKELIDKDGVTSLEGGMAPAGECDSSGLAYIIYTSGSTGKPKGVLTMHHNVTRVVRDANYIDLKKSDRLLQLSSYAFDGSVFDIYGALLNGASLIMAPPGRAADVHFLSRLIRSQCVTVYFVTTALFNLMTDETPEIFGNLRKILFGGERVSPSHARRALEIAGPGKIIHVYGPTESTVFATYYPIDEVQDQVMTIPIGSPLSNTTIYILDQRNNIVPTGVTGEIYIGGPGLARGYLNHPELTSTRFIANSFAGGIYKTGDLGRWLPGGSVQFQGRVDFQVKIRGFRIELGEIETQLTKRPDIKEAVVTVIGGSGDDRALCAYIVPVEYRSGGSYDIVSLKNDLGRKLPAYMVPANILALEKLPLNVNGKLDRAALPLPGQSHAQTAYVPPSTPMERQLVKIWSEILGIQEHSLGIDSDFFEMGGHSLKATIMISRVHRACDVKLPLAEVFRTPTIRELARCISGIRKEKFSAIPPAEKREYYPLSSAQKRLYILNGIAPASTGYNIPYAVTLEGNIHLEALEGLFKQLIQRHDSFRTSFHMIGGQPVQRVHDDVEFKIQDTGPMDDSGPADGLLRPFDLSRAPLVRVLTGMLDDTRRLLLVDMHHIISDGSSMTILATEFMNLASGKALPPLRLQYKDYSQWQNSPAQRQSLKEQENYWLTRFEDEIPVLYLPLDFPRPPVRSLEGSALTRLLPEEDSLWLNRLASASGSTIYMVLLSLYTLLLSKISGQQDIVVGTPVAARRHSDLEPVIGMFVNTLAMRNRAEGEMTFKQFLGQVKISTLEAFENQEYQFEDLVDLLDVPRDTSRNPIFDAFFSLPNMNAAGRTANPPGPQNKPQASQVQDQGGGLKVKPYGPEPETSKFDLGMTCLESPGAIAVTFKYGTKLFKEQTILRLWSYFQGIISALRRDIETCLSDISIISEAEKHRLLFQFNDSSADYPSQKTLHQLFIDRAAQAPNAIALYGPTLEGIRSYSTYSAYLSYSELNNRSGDLSRSLREKGVGPDTIVAIKARRSLEMIAAMLGILKAGGAYLPLSPQYPQDRLDYILKDSNAHWLLDAQGPEPAISTIGEPSPQGGSTAPGNLAYVIYTSGTTGRPKGVMIQHSGAVNVVTWFSRSYGLKPGVRVLNLSDYSFDASVNQIFGALLSGAQLNIVRKEMILELDRLREYIHVHCIDIVNFIPNVLHQLLSFSEKPACLEYVLCGAEKLSDAIKNSLLARGYRVYNHYGPTEASIDTLAAQCRQDVPVHLGKPIANMQCYILDPYNRLQPIGVPGELFIGGTGLARGYLNNPALTASRFGYYIFQNTNDKQIPNSKSQIPDLSHKRSSGVYSNGNAFQAYLYKSGDRARWLPGGNIEFLGRIDQQVKIRGFRIELGEIETRLLECSGVKEAVVTALEEGGGGMRLAAYVVLESPDIADVKSIGKELSAMLPDYMMPAAITLMESFPLTSGGKVNRKQLPAPRYRHDNEFIQPRDIIERTLASLWAGVLGIADVSTIGIDDHFFRVGGHSLNATVLAAKIHKALEVKISLGDIFKTPTIRDLAQLIRNSESESFVSVEPVEKRDYYMLSSAQKRLFVLHRMEPGGVAYNMPKIIAVPPSIAIEHLQQTFSRLIQRHESLRTSFHMVGDTPVQRVHDLVAFSIDNIGEVKSYDQVSRPFDLAVAPLLRVSLAQGGGKGQLLIMDMHHIISDGVSMEILSREFSLLYEGKELEPLRIQYKDYAHWQHSPGHREHVLRQEKYWLRRFDGELPVLDLPLDFPRPDLQNFDGGAHLFNLSAGDSQRLKSLATEKGVTTFMLFLTLFNVFLAKLGNEEDIIVGTPVAGRGHSDLEPVVGMFVNTLALRNAPQGQKSFYDFLEEVKTSCLEDFDNQDYQFEDLVEQVVLERDTSRNPLFDVMFSVQSRDIPDEVPDRDGEERRQTTKFDFSLDVTETPGRFILSLQYCVRLFKQETVIRFARYFRQLTGALLARPQSPLYSAQMIPQDEKHTLLTTFNDTSADYPAHKTLHRFVIDRAAQVPDAIALRGPTMRSHGSYFTYLSYSELNSRSSDISRSLLEKGVGPDTIVAIKAHRSVEMIIALLGILKAGGAYLPLSPEYPQERMDYILKDSNALWLLDAQGAEPVISPLSKASAQVGSIAPGNLTYVIYTSGTTGRPKGVLIHHAGAVNTVSCYTRTIGLKPGWALINFSDYTFDASVAQIFGTLSAGGVLHMITKELLLDIDALRRYMIIHRIAVADFVPAVLHQMLSYDKKIGNVEIAVSGAERLDEHVKNSILAKGYRLFNYYGPTETTIDALRTECRMDRTVDLGTPVSNMRCYVLDKYRQLQPLGVPGELYIAGTGLARGYLNRPELTAEKFIPAPSTLHPSPFTLYRTGDLVRWLIDGHIQFLGRIDHQVKIRGFRIEPGEIESLLRGHDGVKQSAVTVRLDQSGENYLCAYLVLSAEDLTGSGVKQYLASRLPEYMVPGHIVILESMPMTLGGKVNRRALPEPRISAGPDFEPPRGDIEERLGYIWASVLGIDRQQAGATQDFFRLGGHSVNAVTLISRINKHFNVTISLADLFREPTIRGLARLVKDAVQESVASPMPVEKKQYYPLSSQQTRMFILHGVKTDSTAYNMPQIRPLPMDVDRARVEETVRQLIQRHEALRTSFHMIAGRPVQRVHDHVEFSIHMSGPSLPSVRPFDLSRAPLLRVNISRPAGEERLMMVDMHHIISDGVSHQVLLRDFNDLYEGKPLTPLKLHYKDYAVWQGMDEQKLAFMKQGDYWMEQFRDGVPVLHLPVDFPRPPVQNFDGASYSFDIPADQCKRLDELAASSGGTMFMVVLSLFSILLSRLSDQDDIVTGTAVSGRRHADLEGIIGMFVNTLALRLCLPGDKSFDSYLNEVHNYTLEAYENQDYPFEDLLENVSVNRDASRNPLFDVMINFQDEGNLASLTGKALRRSHEPASAKFDLSLNALHAGDDLIFTLTYNTSLFLPDTIERFVHFFKTIIEAVSLDPGQKLSSISLTGDEEARKLLAELNASETTFPQDKTLQQLFTRRAEKHPDAIILYGPTMNNNRSYMSYTELSRRSGRLAQSLREKGVGPGSIVAVKAERSLEMIIALLGILQAGGAYLPLSPEYPPERTDYILKDSSAQWLVTARDGEPAISPLRGGACGTRTANGAGPGNLAYVIYTSGSTGRPKGVLIDQRSAVNVVAWFGRSYDLQPGSRLLNLSDFTFDASVNQIFGSLLHGAQLHMISREMLLHLPGLRQYIQVHQINVINFVPAMLHQLLAGQRKLPSLDIVISGAEALDDGIKDDILSAGYRLYNHYGPTEAAIDTLAAYCRPGEPVTLGHPIANMKCLVLDKNLRLQPPGVPGELYIAGTGLARGYLNNPELTAERFVSYKSQIPACFTVYKSGDRVRLMSDGSFRFMGRIDQQVKIRGYRVEPGEIRAALLKFTEIAEAVVTVVDGPGNEKKLCAYVVPSELEPDNLDTAVLRTKLERFLPAYMIPAHFVSLKKIPLTPGGKTAYRLLPVPALDKNRPMTPPRDGIETKLAEIWSQVLFDESYDSTMPSLGIDDNFFHLGGNSLKATVMSSMVRRELHAHLPLGEIFKTPAIRGLARYISRYEKTSGQEGVINDDRLVPLKKSPDHAPHLFLVHDGSGEVEGYVEFCNHITAPFNCWGIRYDHGQKLAPQNLGIQELAKDYLQALRQIQPQGPYHILGWSMGGTIAFEMTRQLERMGETTAALILIDAVVPFYPGQFPEQHFDIDSELDFLGRYLSDSDGTMQEGLEQIKDIEQLWRAVTDFLVQQKADPELIRRIVQEFEAHVVPSSGDLTIARLIAYLNTGRGFAAARRNYTPHMKINTPVAYFAASQTREKGGIDDKGWEKFCAGTITRTEIEGDHFSIMRKPEVIELAARCSRLLESGIQPAGSTKEQ